MLRDYSTSFEHRAVFLPSISEIYAKRIYGKPFARRMPVAATELDFLNPASVLFFYPWALYSAGQAAKSDAAASSVDNFVSQRNRQQTTIVGDSGGYQIATDTIKWQGDASVLRALRWMEKTTDFSMAFDFPTAAISDGHVRQHRDRLLSEGVDLHALNKANQFGLDYNACLYQTVENNKKFSAWREPGATRVLNVIQGRNEAESRHWYESVKTSAFEGWAFADESARNLAVTLRRLINIRDDGLLPSCEWLHFLGIGELGQGLLYTIIKQSVFESTGTLLGVSFDASSSFLSAARGTVFTGYILDESGWRFAQANLTTEAKNGSYGTLNDFCLDRAQWRFNRVIDDYGMRAVQGTNAFPGGSAIGAFVNVEGDECSIICNGEWDTDSYMVAMNHNTHVMVDAHRMAQNIFFNSVPSQIPNSLKVAAEIIRLVFRDKNPYSLIDQCERELDFAWR